jgi:NDP-sugar pyrophosphorylase family protein
MKAMVLAAGLGTRLGNLTKDKPKALVEVVGKPLLAHVIEKLVRTGFTEVTVNVHHFAQQVIDFINQTDFGVTIHISNESKQLLDTGGAILNAKPFLDGQEPFLIHNVDILSDIDLVLLIKSHQSTSALATLAVSNRSSTRKLLFDSEMLLRGWKHLTTGETIIPNKLQHDLGEFAFSGIHVLSPRIFESIKQQGKFSIIDAYLSLCSSDKIMGYDVSQSYVLDVGKPDSISAAAKFLKLG